MTSAVAFAEESWKVVVCSGMERAGSRRNGRLQLHRRGPAYDVVAGGIQTTPKEFVLIGRDVAVGTNLARSPAGGDVRHGSVKRVAAAVGEGAMRSCSSISIWRI
jgi:hypothetical protein